MVYIEKSRELGNGKARDAMMRFDALADYIQNLDEKGKMVGIV